MLTLYLSPGFSSMAPHIALHEIGVNFESRWISLAKREQYAPEYRALNPEGKVPTLLVDGRPLTEVAAILYYLAKRFPKQVSFRRATSKPRPTSSQSIRPAGSAASESNANQDCVMSSKDR